MDVRLPDGTVIQNVPDGTTKADLVAKLQRNGMAVPSEWLQSAAPQNAPQAQPASTFQQVQASMPGRIIQGMRDPIDAGAQLLPRGLQAITSAAGLFPNKLSDYFGEQAKGVDSLNATNEAAYQAARVATTPKSITGLVTGQQPDPGFDGARMVGNVLSPANAAIASRLPAATSLLGRAAQGAGVGAAGGLLTPVDMSNPDKSFAATKAAQVGIGAVAGGVMTPILGKIGDAAGKFFANRASKAPATADDVERIARSVSREAGMTWEDMEPAAREQMMAQTATALTTAGKRLDPQAAMRKNDFALEGMSPTLGQITRDASQYAQERNLRTLPGVGDGLLQRFEQQGQQLQSKIGSFAGGAQEQYPAGVLISDALKAKDEALRKGVTATYQAARGAAGKDAEVPMQGLAQAYAETLDSFGDKVPSGVRNQFAKFGLDPSTVSNQRKLFTVEEADKLIKVINANQSNDPATNSALGALRGAVKSAVTTDAGVDDVFSSARKLAAERFSLQDAVPALKAAADGTTAPDDFVRRFIVGGKTQEVQGLAKILSQSSPDAFQQARAQIGAELQKAAFGQNVAGDKAFAPERFSQALNKLGSAKLGAFFSDSEIEQMRRLSRIGAYINSMPNAAPVQSSNNWGAVMSVASKIPGVPSGIGLLGSVKNSINNQTAARAALEAKVPTTQLTPEEVGLLSKYLSSAGMGIGLLSAQSVK